jgi:hypothetical protein
VCSSCQNSAFPLEEESYRFLVAALGAPLAEVPDASARALRQVERAIAEQAEHHAHVRLRPLRSSTAYEVATSSSRSVSASSRPPPVERGAVRIDGDG